MLSPLILAHALQWVLRYPPVRGVPSKVSTAAENAAVRYDVPAALIIAVAKVESHFDPRAVSSAGALGIMQIMPGTARVLHVADVFSIKESMNGAARYLSGFISRFGIRQAVFAYNTGHAGTHWQVAHSGYVHAVLHDYHKMRMATWR
jgi:soluble lytic murein transglycosylase-like protein